MRLAVDTGGTFTDLVVEDELGRLSLYKSSTTPDDPVRGVLDVLGGAADELRTTRQDLLGRAELLIHGTTWAINAILTKTTAKTAFLTTRGHPDILLFREGGRIDPFNFTRQYPDAYVSRPLTFEVPERIGAVGEVVEQLDDEYVIEILRKLAMHGVEAVGVCLLWSIVNPTHEQRVAQLLDEHLPGVPYTLSHELNPTPREYRRASSSVIDASLKPLMASYFGSLERRLREAGFSGRLLIMTSSGGVLDATTVAAAPIHSIGSGPAMAPVAGRYYADVDAGADTAVIADTGGTSYDVSLVRRGQIPWTRETWLGNAYEGDLTGFPSVDVKSIGAGGGSIAWVDEEGLLHVGPESAGAQPGPVCYGRGGTRPTVTDAALVLGYLDPAYFLGGAIRLDVGAATEALRKYVARPLDVGIQESAAGVMTLATEHMARAIERITLNQGIDPRSAVLVGGGGAAGLNCVAIARRLGCRKVIIPELGAALSAAGALMSDLTAEYGAMVRTTSEEFDFDQVNRVLLELKDRCRQFVEGPGAKALECSVAFSAEARYPHQVWELEVPLRRGHFVSATEVEQLRQDFHRVHMELFAINDRTSPIEFVAWRARVRCRLREPGATLFRQPYTGAEETHRRVYFPRYGALDVTVRPLESVEINSLLDGPMVIESPVTTIVIEPGAAAERLESGSLLIHPLRVPEAMADVDVLREEEVR